MTQPLTNTELLAGPTALPVTTEELREHLWTVYPEHSTDELLTSLIKAATNHIESITWRKLMSQQWRLYLNEWPEVSEIKLPFGSVLSVESVSFLDAEGEKNALSDEVDYLPALYGIAPSVVVVGGWPSAELFRVGGVRVDFTAGFGVSSDDLPNDIRQAVLLLAAHWYESREAVVVGTTVRKVPYAVDALVNPWKLRRM